LTDYARCVDEKVRVERVGSEVALQRERGELARAASADQRVPRALSRSRDGPDQLAIAARLFAETTAGVRLNVPYLTMSAGLWRRGPSAITKRYVGPPLPDDPDAADRVIENYRVQRHDVEDAINQLLGRDPEQHRPPRLAWDPLIALLAANGIALTEQQLIAMPFVFEFTDQLLGELAAIGTDAP
jgi:hypothetical protein